MADQENNANKPGAGEIIVNVPELSGRQKIRLVGMAILNRLRFVAVLIGVLLFVGYWDTIKLHWDRWTHPRAAAVRELPAGQEFFCPMDPQVTRSGYESNGDVPSCPICGMPLSLHEKSGKEELPHGVTGRVTLSPDRVQMAGIKTVPVEYRPMVKHIRTVGYVTFDESGLSRIVSRVDGYIDKLYADKSYAMVHKGDPLAEIYSPELYSTATQLVVSSKVQGEAEIAASARCKLVLLGVDPEDIDRMVAAGEPARDMLIRSPRAGHVIDKRIVAGASVEAKMTLFEVADLSTVWIEADVYENDAPFLQAGQEISAKVESYPNRIFKGTIALVHPHFEEATRTNRVRVRLENPNHELRPGMFAEVTIDAQLEAIEPYKSLAVKREFLVVPEGTVIDSGDKTIVYVERAEGQYEGREVELGPRQDQFYPVLKGLAEGDKVAAAGSFLVDAETRLNPAAASTYFGATYGQTLAAPASGRKVTADNQPKPGPRAQPTAEDLKKHRYAAQRRGPPASQSAGHLPHHRSSLGLDGSAREDHASR